MSVIYLMRYAYVQCIKLVLKQEAHNKIPLYLNATCTQTKLWITRNSSVRQRVRKQIDRCSTVRFPME